MNNEETINLRSEHGWTIDVQADNAKKNIYDDREASSLVNTFALKRHTQGKFPYRILTRVLTQTTTSVADTCDISPHRGSIGLQVVCQSPRRVFASTSTSPVNTSTRYTRSRLKVDTLVCIDIQDRDSK